MFYRWSEKVIQVVKFEIRLHHSLGGTWSTSENANRVLRPDTPPSRTHVQKKYLY